MLVTVNSFTFPENTNAGQYDASTSLRSFPAWCAEQSQFLYFGQTIEYEYIFNPPAWMPYISLELDTLLSWANDNGWPANAWQSEDLQVQIWSILGGGHSTIDLTGQDVYVHASLLHSPTYQDLLVTYTEDREFPPFPPTVPEPSGALIFGLALILAFRFFKRT